jgi:uncharacterized glyoxalase superfamily protein PhnB
VCSTIDTPHVVNHQSGRQENEPWQRPTPIERRAFKEPASERHRPLQQGTLTSSHSPRIYPFLRFADADAALEWLSRAFGFGQRAVDRNDEGAIHHAEISLGPGIVMFGQGDAASQGVYVAVDDADAHYRRARAAGAEIVREIEDTPYGSREYTACDLEGHVWHFGTYRPTVG